MPSTSSSLQKMSAANHFDSCFTLSNQNNIFAPLNPFCSTPWFPCSAFSPSQ
jgi:hypothetical protein